MAPLPAGASAPPPSGMVPEVELRVGDVDPDQGEDFLYVYASYYHAVLAELQRAGVPAESAETRVGRVFERWGEAFHSLSREAPLAETLLAAAREIALESLKRTRRRRVWQKMAHRWRKPQSGARTDADYRTDELDSTRPGESRREGAIRIQLLCDEMVEIYRGWTPARRLAASDDMMRFACDLLRGVLRQDHPDWTEEEIQREIARRILGAPLPGDVE